MAIVGSDGENIRRVADDAERAVAGLGGSATSASQNLDKVKTSSKDAGKALDELSTKLSHTASNLEQSAILLNKNMAYVAKDFRDSYLKGKIVERMLNIQTQFETAENELKTALKLAQKSAATYAAAAEKTHSASDIAKAEAAQRKASQAKEALTQFNQMSDYQKLRKKYIQDTKDLIYKSAQKLFSDIYTYAKTLLNESYSRDKSTIESNYTAIMSMNSYNAGEYAKIIDRIGKRIEEAGLSSIISTNTVQENIVKSLNSGLQDAVAEANAFYASVAEKTGITFDWYSSEWTQMISQMAQQGKDYNAVMQQVIKDTDNLAEYYHDSTGLANGRAVRMMSAASNIGMTYGLDASTVADVYKSLTITSQELSKYGIESTSILQDVESLLVNGINNDNVTAIFGGAGVTSDVMKQKLQNGEFGEILSSYMDRLQGLYDNKSGEMLTALSRALGGSLNPQDYQKLQNYWANNGSFSSNFEKAYKHQGDTLESIYDEMEAYMTPEEKWRTHIQNTLDDIAEYFVQHPILGIAAKTGQGLLEGLVGGAVNFGFNSLMLKKFLNGYAGGEGEAGATGGLANTFKAGMGKAGQLFSNGATGFGAGNAGSLASKITSSRLGKVAFSTGGKALGAAGSALWIGYDAYKGYQENGAAGALRGAITGSGKDAESGGDVAKGAGIAALKGAGIGMMFGPWGAAIGGAIGAVAGFAITMNDLIDEEKSWARAVSKATKNVNELASSLNDLDLAQKEYETSLSDYKSIKETINALKAGQEPTSELIGKFSNYSSLLDSNGKVTNKYIDALKTAVDLEQQLNEIKFNEATQKAAKKLSGHSSDINTHKKELSAATNAAQVAAENETNYNNFISAISKADSVTYDSDGIYADGKLVASNEELELWYDSPRASKDIVKQDIIWANAKVGIDIGGGMTLTSDKKEFGKQRTANYNNAQKQNTSAVKRLAAAQQQAALDLASDRSLAHTWSDNFTTQGLPDVLAAGGSLLDWGVDNGWDMTGTGKGSFRSVLKQYSESLSRLIENDGSEFNKSQYIAPSSIVNAYKSTVQDFNPSYTPAFATGTPGTTTIPHDNYLALLHRGEQVRTAAEVAIEKTEEHIASTNVLSTINTSLVTQTNTIIDILRNIYTVISSKANKIITKDPMDELSYNLPGI